MTMARILGEVHRLAEDRGRSPSTGWTRTHWEAVADATLAAVRPFASPGHALIELPGPASVYGRRSDGLEGFARTFLAAGFRLAGSRRAGASVGAGDDALGGLAQWYAEGLAAGVDPSSPERWPGVNEIHQARVEAASVVIALHESRHLLWNGLNDRVREQTVEWLAGVIEQPYPDCNWLWFQSLVEAFLRSVGGPWSPSDLERTIARTEDWYVGNGWYTDGFEGGTTARNFDWYAGWAMSFYPLWYCRISAELAEPGLAERYRERLRLYLEDAQHLYAPDGPPLHQGRSLTYRHAALAPLWAGVIFEASPLPPGQLRRLASGVLRHFASSGAWDARGLQPIGWYGSFPAIRQPYSGPGSPYWSSKAFAGLVLPVEHPVWADVEEPLSIERRDVELTLTAPGWLISGTRQDGVVRMVNHGTDHGVQGSPDCDDPAYSRHGYSTHTGPEYDSASWQSPVDGHVALVDAAGRASHRRPLIPLGVHGRVGRSRSRTHWPVTAQAPEFVWPRQRLGSRLGPWLTTASVLRGAVEIRLARVDPAGAEPDPAPGPWTLQVGGYALASALPPAITMGRALAVASGGPLVSAVVGLHGLPVARMVERQGTNAFGPFSAIPVVASGSIVELGKVYAAAVIITGSVTAAGGDGQETLAAAVRAMLPQVTVSLGCRGAAVRVLWPGGELDEFHLDAPPRFCTLGGSVEG